MVLIFLLSLTDIYEDRTHLCCGPEFEKVLQHKKTRHDLCCGKAFYNPRNECCCDETLQVVRMDPENSKCCQKRDPLTGSGSPHSKQQMGLDPQSHSEEYQELTKVRKAPGVSALQCCGAKPYQLSEEGVLCCNGQLYRNQPAGSMCAGNVPYSPDTYTVCQKRVHLPASKQCCGKESFDPHMEICCNGHSAINRLSLSALRHKRSRVDMACCGFNAYSPSAGKHKCCSGNLHDMKDKGEAGCCGSLLLTDMRNQQCCHSTQKTLVYKSLPGHSCCGHWYYNMSIWSCCAGQLIPTPTNSSAGTQAWAEDFILRPLTDYDFSAICTRTVMLGTVQSSAVKGNQRFVVLANALKIQGKRGIVKAQDNSFLVGPLEHCSTPPLEQDRTYLWKKISGHQYKPISDVPDLTTALYSIMTFCQSMAKQ
ncbi:hypothetical protein NFI96_025940 [Prochilodus magdalenae]|nr:hypothetical protein NFI96_025940 [Prochilodus magdalenae]